MTDKNMESSKGKPKASGLGGTERSSAAGMASQMPKGGAAQDQFGQSGDQGTTTQTERNARPGSK